MPSRFHILLILVVAAIFSSCIRRPEHVLSDKEMAPLMADIELADAYWRMNPGVSAEDRELLLKDILAKHGVSRGDYDSTMSWYGKHIDKYYDLCDLVDKDLKKKKERLSGNRSAEIESSDLWPYVRTAYFSPRSVSDGMEFSIPSPEISPGQRLQWKLKFFIPADGTSLLGVEYDDGSITYTTSSFRGNKLDVMLQTDTSKSVSRIFGNLMLENTRRSLWADSISMQALPFDSLEYYSIHTQRIWKKPTRRKAAPRAVTSEDSLRMSMLAAPSQ